MSKTWFVDFEAKGYGMLTTYVEASCKRAAIEGLKRYVAKNGTVGGEKIIIKNITAYPIDRIPADHAYLDENGEFLLPKKR